MGVEFPIRNISRTPVREALAYLLRDCVAPVNLELAAYEQRNKQMLVELVELVMMDPWTTSETQARNMIDAVLALPVHAEMRAHYEG